MNMNTILAHPNSGLKMQFGIAYNIKEDCDPSVTIDILLYIIHTKYKEHIENSHNFNSLCHKALPMIDSNRGHKVYVPTKMSDNKKKLQSTRKK